MRTIKVYEVRGTVTERDGTAKTETLVTFSNDDLRECPEVRSYSFTEVCLWARNRVKLGTSVSIDLVCIHQYESDPNQ